MTNRECETFDNPEQRTREDYIQILKEGQTLSFGEYDNYAAFFSLIDDGIAEIDPTHNSTWTSMFQSVWLRLK